MVAANTVDFYSKSDYDTLAKTTQLNGVEHQKLGTSYLSCKLGDGTKLLVWNHEDYTDRKELTSDQSNFPKDKSVQCYQVLKGTSAVIGFRFKDATGGEKGQYSLLLKLANIGDVKVWSDESDKYALAGSVPRDGTLVTTALYVQDKNSGQFPVIGSIYFKWDKDKNKVVVEEQEGWPKKQLKHEDDGHNNFTITLISTKP
ncbi:membrane binding-domain-containing protein [Aspergillus tamarii]|uniref:Membrane binding-domain-containing protein n=1 Tax=Aspergillus tamarii TaxID=41984 RepID=A0A5N6V0R1_ASPTM|nr:membrane binding-domain-containing protein [Aspergillus tamarii]